MPRANFEEREYEQPLYRELLGADRRLWPPGQVLEERVGFDAALFVGGDFLFDLHGLGPPPGIIPSRHWWYFRRQLGVPRRRSLPNYSVNVFLQAKRPFALTRAPRSIVPHGLSGRCWRVEIEQDQQLVLERLAKKFATRALVAYAAPAFHTERDLYRNTISGSLVASSTFPSALTLATHSSWYYKLPGATGVAHSKPTPADEPDILSRVKALRGPDGGPSASGDDGVWKKYLAVLARDVIEVLSEDAAGSDFRRAKFFELVREYRDWSDGPPTEVRQPLADFATVAAMASVFRLAWLVAA